MFRAILLKAAVLGCVFLALLKTSADACRLRRGSVGLSVFVCLCSDSPPPSRTPAFLESLSICSGTGGHADYWKDISYGTINLGGSRVLGWYRMNKTIAESKAYGGGGSKDRIKKFTDCRDRVAAAGYTAPSDHIMVAITSPGIDAFGGSSVFLGETTDVGLMSHEVGHALALQHSYSDDPTYRNAPWSSIGEYDDEWDVMSWAHVKSKSLGSFGRGGPGLNAYHRDRMGWIARDKTFRFGEDGISNRTLTLTALNRPRGSGIHLIRIPFDVTDVYRYYTVEYRLKQGWDSGFASDIVLIHEVKKRSNGRYASYLLRDRETRKPKQSIIRTGARIDVISKDPSNGRAAVRIVSTVATDRRLAGVHYGPNTCKAGVWREADQRDWVCVTGERRSEVFAENLAGPSRRRPGGGAFGSDTCRPGYVWRAAFPGDHVCVPPSSRTKAAIENEQAYLRLEKPEA